MKAEAKHFEALALDQIVDIEVKGILDFGVSVFVGELTGFIHISELSWGKVEKISKIYEIGDKLKAKIITLDKDKRALKLSVKQLEEDPWNSIETKYQVGVESMAVITKITNFGAFAKLEEGIEGLIHISDFAWNKKKVNITDYVKVGDEVNISILELEVPSKKT